MKMKSVFTGIHFKNDCINKKLFNDIFLYDKYEDNINFNETKYLTSTKANIKALDKSIKDVENRKLVEVKFEDL